jgi:peptide/nickel transport system ATP-binding protein
VESGTAQQIFSNPQHEYTQALLAAVPHLGQGADSTDVDVTAALAAATHAELESVDHDELVRRERENQTALKAAAEEASRPKGEPVLELVDVAIEYPKQGRVPAFRAVEGANLVIYPGQVVGLVGESGSGKTTIGRAAVGLLPVAEGSMRVVGQDISAAKRNGKQLHQVRRDIGMVFQDPSSSLNPRLPIGESIGEPMFLAGVAKGVNLQKRIETLLDQVELPRGYRNRYPHELSGGQKQRVGIARALSLQPKLMVADEPTSALDVSVQAKVLELFQNLQRELGFACLFVTHDLAVVDVLADRICVMQRGRIVEQGTREQILRNPQEPYTQRLLAAVPLPDPEKQRERRELRAQLMAAGIE